MNNLETNHILRAFKHTLGNDYVKINQSSREGTYHTHQSTAIIIAPANKDQIKACLDVAKSNNIGLYPVSIGKNWGYGCATPTSENTVKMSLHRLAEISHYNSELGYITIEPGVTQRQLADYLKSNGDKHWMDCSGSSSDCSVLGNSLDRGFGYTPYSDHAKHIISMEVILPDGSVINTGHGQFKNAHTSNTYKAGTGPAINGLFVQSNLGIVTKLTIELMPKPEYFEAFFFSINSEDKLPHLINTLAKLRKSQHIQSAVHIGNALRVIPAFTQYPWEESNYSTPLPEQIIKKYQKKYAIGAWNGSGALYGSKKEINIAKKRIKFMLGKSVDRLRFVNENKLSIVNFLNEKLSFKKLQHLDKTLKILNPIIGIMRGEPADSVLAATYWRKKSPPPSAHMDPERDKCGLIWCSPVAPANGKHAEAISEIAKRILPKYGYEAAITITIMDELNIENIISITYDREDNEDNEDNNALACYFELEETLARSGYYPYRLGIHAMKSTLCRSDEAYKTLLRKIKQAVDPDNIISPGRYII